MVRRVESALIVSMTRGRVEEGTEEVPLMLEEVGFVVDLGDGGCPSVKWLDIRVTVCLFLRQATMLYAHGFRTLFGIRRRFDISCCEAASIFCIL